MYKILILLLTAYLVRAQGIIAVNTNQVISIMPKTLMSVHGPMWNQQDGYFFNQGTLMLKDSLINDNPDSCFIRTNPGNVVLFGSEQHVTGLHPIRFDTLTLEGNSGTKFFHVNAFVDVELNLKDRRLHTTNDTIFVRNPSVDAIKRTSGFVSSDLNGSLVRYTNSTSVYLFPVGDSFPIFRYRPVEITPTTTNHSVFAVRFVNYDATTEGFDRNKKDTTICIVNPDYFHRINSPTNTQADVTIYYEANDQVKKGIAQWDNYTGQYQWNNKTPMATNNGNSWTLSQWQNYDSEAFAFIGERPFSTITITPNDTILCEGDTLTLTATPNPDWTYQWSNGQTGNPIKITQGGTYYVIVSDTSLPQSCPTPSSDTITITFIADFSPTIFIEDSIICKDDSTLIYVEPDNDSLYTYTWYKEGAPLQGYTGSSIYVNEEGIYYAEVSNVCFSYLTTPIMLLVMDSTYADFMYKPDTILLLEPATFISTSYSNVINPITSYTWTINGIPMDYNKSFQHVFEQPDSFLVGLEINTLEGCKDTIYKWIRVENIKLLYIPNAFTPNNDGLNEIFEIFGTGIERIEVIIFNRWGELIWQGVNKFWDGTSRGVPVPEGAYVYVVKARFKDKSEVVRTGTVQVIR